MGLWITPRINDVNHTSEICTNALTLINICYSENLLSKNVSNNKNSGMLNFMGNINDKTNYIKKLIKLRRKEDQEIQLIEK